MSAYSRLLATSGLAHAADQLALAMLPITAVIVLGSGPATAGLLVAAQTAAWLLVSIPAGLAVDRLPRCALLIAALALTSAAAIAAMVAAGLKLTAALAGVVFVATAGIVILALLQLAIVPMLVPATDLPRANSHLELARASAVALAPAAAGILAETIEPLAGYVVAAFLACAAFFVALAVPVPRATPRAGQVSAFSAVSDGARFVWTHPILRAIAVCAVFWNFAFVALMASFLPFAIAKLGADAASAGLAQGANGLGMVVGALVAGSVVSVVQPRLVLVFGPCVSALAAVAILVSPQAGGLLAASMAFFAIGFGPMLWLVMQTSIRQMVTPSHMMGRVSATIQVAIYGVRPIGALAGGFVGQFLGLDAAMALVAMAFLASALAAVFSRLSVIDVMPERVQ